MVLSPCSAVCVCVCVFIYIGLRPLKKIGEPKKRGATSAQSAQSQLSHRNHRKGSPPTKQALDARTKEEQRQGAQVNQGMSIIPSLFVVLS